MSKEKTQALAVVESPNQEIMSMQPQEIIAGLMERGSMVVELRPPDGRTLALLREETTLAEAEALSIESQGEYDLALLSAAAIRTEAEEIEVARAESTKPMGRVKSAWDALFKPAIQNRLLAVSVIHSKLKEYEATRREEAAAARREQERLLAAERERLEAEAAEERRRAERLRSPRAKEAAARRADDLEQTAAMTPTTLGTPTTATPTMGTGSRAKVWKGRVTDELAFLAWLVEKERTGLIKGYNQSALNALAKEVGDVRTVPGFRAEQDTSYRR